MGEQISSPVVSGWLVEEWRDAAQNDAGMTVVACARACAPVPRSIEEVRDTVERKHQK